MKNLIFFICVSFCVLIAKSSSQKIAYKLNAEWFTQEIFSLCFLKDDLFVAGHETGTMSWFNLTTKSLIQTTRVHTGAVWSLIQLPSGELVSCSDDSTIIIWKKDSFEPRLILQDDFNRVLSITFQMTSKFDYVLVSTASDGSIKIWSPVTGSLLRKIEKSGEPSITKTLMLASVYMAFGSSDKSISIIDMATGAEVKKLVKHTDTIYGLQLLDMGQFVYDKTYVASLDMFGGVNVWDLTQAEPKLVSSFFVKDFGSITFSFQGLKNGQVAIGGTNSKVYIYDALTGKLMKTLVKDNYHSYAYAMAYLPSQNYLAVSNYEQIIVWDLN